MALKAQCPRLLDMTSPAPTMGCALGQRGPCKTAHECIAIDLPPEEAITVWMVSKQHCLTGLSSTLAVLSDFCRCQAC